MLAAFYQQIPVGHVEAGLRSGNIYSPYPEEMNRRITGTIAEYHFAPTEGNRENLIECGVDDKNIFVTGNTVIDALQIQEEAPALGKPVLVLRKETGRPEAVEAGTVKIAGVEEDNTVALTNQLLADHSEYLKMARAVNPYGDGKAAKRIIETLKNA